MRFRRIVQLTLDDGGTGSCAREGGLPLETSPAGAPAAARSAARSFVDVAEQVGLDFRQGAFRFGVSNDTTAMMGGGLCWLDYDSDGWLDLFVVNSYAQARHRARGRRRAGCRGARSTATSTAGSRT